MQRRRMIMDYTARYGLEFNPFLKNSKEVLVETQEYKEVLFRLNYLLTTKGFGLLTGSAGRGKTTAVRNWASGLNTSLYKVVYSSLSTLTVNDFYRNLAAELGAQPGCCSSFRSATAQQHPASKHPRTFPPENCHEL